jgi:hypothetical protein
VRPEGLEPPAYWFEARHLRSTRNLAPHPLVVRLCALLPVIKHFAREAEMALATARTTSMQGVGTKLGTVGFVTPPAFVLGFRCESQRKRNGQRGAKSTDKDCGNERVS